MKFVAVDDDLPQGMSPGDLKKREGKYELNCVTEYLLQKNLDEALLTFCLSSSVLASLLTFAQGRSFGHQTGLVDSFPQPGFPLPVEYFSIKGMNALSCA